MARSWSIVRTLGAVLELCSPKVEDSTPRTSSKAAEQNVATGKLDSRLLSSQELFGCEL